MEHSKEMLQEMLVMVMRLVNESWPDEAAYIVGMVMGQISRTAKAKSPG